MLHSKSAIQPYASTLIVSTSELMRSQAYIAFEGIFNAYFCMYGESIRGMRFNRIICLQYAEALRKEGSCGRLSIERWTNELSLHLEKDAPQVFYL